MFENILEILTSQDADAEKKTMIFVKYSTSKKLFIETFPGRMKPVVLKKYEIERRDTSISTTGTPTETKNR